ncbi:cyclic lactone autoinducer peptide [Cohnella candidum]|uniref:Cyclic lactone autoinducer peptide n=1 Tax=Cohnella candidum TaxID=2674991 RepID=A0A3G3JZ69_9BACL|nr:cyclic lactone autoinducer peptide [Cohnella candidum]AYQ73534.1 cyclic lactone autoinducer peptide [Cohnella candidum]
MSKKVVIGVSKLLAVFAVVFVSTASLFAIHRPEIPAELKK